MNKQIRLEIIDCLVELSYFYEPIFEQALKQYPNEYKLYIEHKQECNLD
jgi:hypothetical protein